MSSNNDYTCKDRKNEKFLIWIKQYGLSVEGYFHSPCHGIKESFMTVAEDIAIDKLNLLISLFVTAFVDIWYAFIECHHRLISQANVWFTILASFLNKAKVWFEIAIKIYNIK